MSIKKWFRDMFLCFSIIVLLPLAILLDWLHWVDSEVYKDLQAEEGIS